jgi:chemotaxis response regulator CheB
MIPPIDRTACVAAAAAHDLNNELTVIISNLHLLDPVDKPACSCVAEMQAAAQRAVAEIQTLQKWAASRGARPNAATAEQVVGLFESRRM